MNIVLLVYLAGVVDQIVNTSQIMLLVFFSCYGFYLFMAYMDNDGKKEKRPYHGKKATSIIVLFLALVMFVPSQKTIYLMAGASVAQDIANSPKTTQALDKIYKIIDNKLDDQLAESIKKGDKK